MRPSHTRLLSTLLLTCLSGTGMLSACSNQDHEAQTSGDHPTVETLPAPGRVAGSVTGMPDAPGPNAPGIADEGPASAASVVPPAEGDIAIGEEASNPETTGIDAPVVEPTPQDALALVRDYYAAIESRNFDRAYALWADDGRASRQTPQQFAAGFAQTTHVAATLDTPGRIEGAAGSRFIEIPVAIEAAQQDGSVRRYVGAYTLRRAVVDGATPEQRAWRIASADIREVAQ